MSAILVCDIPTRTAGEINVANLPAAISCSVTETTDGEYTAEMRYPRTGANADKLTVGRTLIISFAGKRQYFDITSVNKDISGILEIRAEHVSYRLGKYIFAPLAPYARTAGIALAKINVQMCAGDSSAFVFSTTLTDSKTWGVEGIYPNCREVLFGMEGSILDTYGGAFEFDNFNVRLLESRGADNGLKIEYGRNMTGFELEYDTGAMANTIYGYWNDTTGTAADVVYSYDIPNAFIPASTQPQALALDLSAEFETQPTAAQLRTKCAAYARANQTGQPRLSLDVSFVLMSQTANDPTRSYMSQLESAALGDTVRVIFPAYDFSASVKVVKTEYNVLAERYNAITLDSQPRRVSNTIYGLTRAGYNNGVMIFGG